MKSDAKNLILQFAHRGNACKMRKLFRKKEVNAEVRKIGEAEWLLLLLALKCGQERKNARNLRSRRRSEGIPGRSHAVTVAWDGTCVLWGMLRMWEWGVHIGEVDKNTKKMGN